MANHDVQCNDGDEFARGTGMGGTGCQSKTVSVLSGQQRQGGKAQQMGARGNAQPNDGVDGSHGQRER